MDSKLVRLLKGKAKYQELASKLLPVEWLLVVSSDAAAFRNDADLMNRVRREGVPAATALLGVLGKLPEQVATKPIQFVLGYEPLGPPNPVGADGEMLALWQGSLATLYRLALTDMTYSNAETTEAFVKDFHAVVSKLDAFATSRMEFWERERASKMMAHADTTKY